METVQESETFLKQFILSTSSKLQANVLELIEACKKKLTSPQSFLPNESVKQKSKETFGLIGNISVECYLLVILPWGDNIFSDIVTQFQITAQVAHTFSSGNNTNTATELTEEAIKCVQFGKIMDVHSSECSQFLLAVDEFTFWCTKLHSLENQSDTESCRRLTKQTKLNFISELELLVIKIVLKHLNIHLGNEPSSSISQIQGLEGDEELSQEDQFEENRTLLKCLEIIESILKRVSSMEIVLFLFNEYPWFQEQIGLCEDKQVKYSLVSDKLLPFLPPSRNFQFMTNSNSIQATPGIGYKANILSDLKALGHLNPNTLRPPTSRQDDKPLSGSASAPIPSPTDSITSNSSDTINYKSRKSEWKSGSRVESGEHKKPKLIALNKSKTEESGLVDGKEIGNKKGTVSAQQAIPPVDDKISKDRERKRDKVLNHAIKIRKLLLKKQSILDDQFNDIETMKVGIENQRKLRKLSNLEEKIDFNTFNLANFDTSVPTILTMSSSSGISMEFKLDSVNSIIQNFAEYSNALAQSTFLRLLFFLFQFPIFIFLVFFSILFPLLTTSVSLLYVSSLSFPCCYFFMTILKFNGKKEAIKKLIVNLCRK